MAAGLSASSMIGSIVTAASSNVITSSPSTTPPSSSSSSSLSSSIVYDNGTGAPTAGSGTMAKYKMIKKIGQGNFGVVFLAEWAEDHKVYVVKQIDMAQLSPTERDGAVQETKLLASLRHPYIVGYQESFVEKDLLNIVMQYCDGGDLASRIRAQAAMRAPSASAMVSSSAGSTTSSSTSSSIAGVSSTTPLPTTMTSPTHTNAGEPVHFAEEQILDWFVQIAVALKHCHNHKIIHRDLKSQNVFLTRSNEVRLGDFGIARVLGGTTEMAMTVVGTPYSMSPEVCENKPYSFKSDVWALGCVLYEMCVLKHAFDAHNLLGLVWKIVQESYPPIPPSYSDDLRGLIKLLLQKDPRQRPTIDEILDIPFVRQRLNAQIASKTTLVNNSRKATTMKKGQFKPTALGLGHSSSSTNTVAPQHPSSVSSSGTLGTLAFAPGALMSGASTPLHSSILTSTFGSLHGTLGPLSGTVVGTAASMGGNTTMGPTGTRRAGAVASIAEHAPVATNTSNDGEVTEMIEVMDDFEDEFGPAQGHHSGPVLTEPILDESEPSPTNHLDFEQSSPHGNNNNGLLGTAAFGGMPPVRASIHHVNGGAMLGDTMAFSTTTAFRPDSVSAPARDNYTLGSTMMSSQQAIEEDMDFPTIDEPSHVGGHLAGTVRTGAPVVNTNNNAPSPTFANNVAVGASMSGSMSLHPLPSPSNMTHSNSSNNLQQPGQSGTPRTGDGFVLPRLASPRNTADFELIPKKVTQQQRLAEMARRKEAANAKREAELAAAHKANLTAKRGGGGVVGSSAGRGGYTPTNSSMAASMSTGNTTASSGYGGNRPQPITAGMMQNNNNGNDELPSPHSAPVMVVRTSSGPRIGTAPSTPSSHASHMSGTGAYMTGQTGPSPKKHGFTNDSRPTTTARQHPSVAAIAGSGDPSRHRSAGSSRMGPRGSLSGASGGNGISSNSAPLPSGAMPSPSNGRLPTATRTSRSPSWENTPIRASGRYSYPDGQQAYNMGHDRNNHHPELYDTIGSSVSEYAADFEEDSHYTDPSVQEAQDQLAAMQRAARHTALVPVKGAAPITPHSAPTSAFDDMPTPTPASQVSLYNGNPSNINTPSVASREEKVLTPFETKCAAMKTKVLKSISESQFEEIYKHFKEGFDGRAGGTTKQSLIDKWHLKDDVLMNIEQMVYMDAMKPSPGGSGMTSNGSSKPSQMSLPVSSSTPKQIPLQSPTRISPPTPSRGDRSNGGIVGPSPSRPGTHARLTTGNSAGRDRPTSGAPVRAMDTPTNLNSQFTRESVSAPISSAGSPPPGSESNASQHYGEDRPIRRSTSTEHTISGAVFTFGALPQSGGIGHSVPPMTSSTRSSSSDDRALGTARSTAVRKGTGTLASSAKKKPSNASERSLFNSSGSISSGYGSDRRSISDRDRSSSISGHSSSSDSATSSLRGPSARRKPALDSGSGHR